MKKLMIIVYMAIMMLTCKGCGTVEFDHDYEEIYTTTVTRAVGPSIILGARVLPDGAGPYVYLAPNGDDGNNGSTPALSVLTPQQAITQLGVLGRDTVHVIRNGYVGDLIFPLDTAYIIIPASKNFQAELGEIAIFDGESFGWSFQLNNSSKLDGIKVFHDINEPALTALGTNAVVTNCWFEYTGNDPAKNSFLVDFSWSNSITYSVMIDNFICLNIENDVTTTYTDIDNNIFIGKSPASTQDTKYDSLLSPLGIRISDNSADPVVVSRTFNVNNSIFANLYCGISDDESSEVTNVSFKRIININNSAFVGTQYAAMPLSSNDAGLPAGTNYVKYTLNYCFAAILSSTFAPSGIKASVPASQRSTFLIGVETVETNIISPSTIPFYIDQVALTAEGFRLQAIGKATSTGAKYFIDSPLIGAGLAGVDVNPWEETTVFTSRAFNKTTALVWPPSLYKIRTQFVNAITQNDVLGNPHSSFDAIRRAFDFSFGDGSNYANNQDLRRLITLLADTGSQKFYPIGKGKTLFINPESGNPDAVEGFFDSTNTNSFAPSSFSGIPLMPYNWQGHWITILGKEYYIASNDTGFFYLQDPLSEGFPSDGLQTFIIDYILVQPDLKDLEAVQQRFTNFLFGGSNRETADLTTLAHELSGYSVAFNETSNLEEAG